MAAKLPENLLELILERLIPLSGDYFRFGVVCKTWGKIMTENQKRMRNSQSQIPVLMIPSKKNVKTRSIYDVTQSNRFDSLHPRVPYNIKACGSSYGWLFFLEKTMQIVLYNPFVYRTRKNYDNVGKVVLPVIMPRPNAWLHEYSVGKVMLFGNPSTTPNYVVLAFYDAPRRLALLKSWSSPREWMYVKDICKDDSVYDKTFADAIFHKGLIYVLNACKGIYTIDAFSEKLKDNNAVEIKHVIKWNEPYWSRMYIVESSKGELLLVKRLELEVGNEFNPVTMKFEVFKVVCDDGDDTMDTMVQVDSLDGDAIFVGDGQSVCVSSCDFEHCEPNSIYFTDDGFMFDYDVNHTRTSRLGPRDSGIFSLQDKTIKPLYPYDPKSRKDLPPALWVLPMF